MIGKKIITICTACALNFSLCVGVLSGCAFGKTIVWDNDPEYGSVAPTHLEYGEMFAVPDAIVGNKRGDYFGDAVLKAVADPNGEPVALAGNTFIAEKKGDYQFTFAAVDGAMEKVLSLPCKDTLPPRVSISPDDRYEIKQYGETQFKVHEFPYISSYDVSGIDESKTVCTLQLNGKEVVLENRKFTLEEEGILKFKVYVEDRDGNGCTVEKTSVSYERMLPPRTPAAYNFADDALEGFTLASFDREEYTENVGYDGNYLFNEGDFKAEILASDSDGTVQYDGVLKLLYDGKQVRSAARLYFKPVAREDVGSLDITIRAENAYKSPVNDDWFNIIFFNPAGGQPYWLRPNVHDFLGDKYRTFTIDDPLVLDSLANPEGFIDSIVIETFDGQDKTLYIAEIGYTPPQKIFMDETLEGNTLATFDREEYLNNASYADTWLRRPYQQKQIVTDSDAPHKKALKISYTAGESIDEACVEIFLAKPVQRQKVKSLQITLRVENFSVRDGLFNMLFFKDAKTPWGVPSVLAIATEQYAQYTVSEKSVLNAMTDEDGYIRSFHIETFGGSEARYLYLAEISFEEETDPQPEKKPFVDQSLQGNCLASFDREEYVNNAGAASDVFTNYWPQTAEISIEDGKLKIVYGGTRGESWVRIYFGAAVKRTDVSSIDVSLRLENCNALNNDSIYLVLFGNTSEWAKEGWYTHPNVGVTQGTFRITDASVLDQMTDADGYIRSVALVTFGGTNQTIYVDEITYTA